MCGSAFKHCFQIQLSALQPGEPDEQDEDEIASTHGRVLMTKGTMMLTICRSIDRSNDVFTVFQRFYAAVIGRQVEARIS
jgi:hypothetical protein